MALRKHAEEKLKKSHVDLTLANQELQASMEKLKTAQNQILSAQKNWQELEEWLPVCATKF